ncbi:MBL fold metallo-hydrolase [Anseongella ginsenosidimutans]|uniref:MBL fold metallo-hydrolase n=1 Tax=Anseongella ginsenosidimutans TaxID=496056 RepID=UPI001315A3DF|nr:MBL fold metallo-hydrolase [Anseongella ginsenosidimutans]
MRSLGKLPAGNRLERIKASPNYRENAFRNQEVTSMLSEDASYLRMIRESMRKDSRRSPAESLPVVSSGFPAVSGKPVVTWFGHSSYLIQTESVNLLVDPVFSQRASFSSYLGPKAYAFSTDIPLKDLPRIDIVILTHDHYDHLDHRTIRQLRSTVKAFYTPLGVGSHLAFWGIEESRITELDWEESAELPGEMKLTATPARHFSGRGFIRNKTLWASYVLETADCRLYLGGDSGYGKHFAEIGRKYGPFDMVILENGQYNPQWPLIHMMPEETVRAAIDLKGEALLPVHWGRFSLSLHAWDDPVIRLVKEANEMNVKVATPKIGEPVVIGGNYPSAAWWSLEKGSTQGNP